MRQKSTRLRARPAGNLWEPRRLALLTKLFRRTYNREASLFISVPGRTELGGNHTDHHRGKVLAASVGLDLVAAVAPRSDDNINVSSEGFAHPFFLHVKETAPREEEKGTSTSLIRGIVAFFAERGFGLGGFDACIAGSVGIGSGLSSSACFEVLIGSVLNVLHNRGRATPLEIARAGQFAENRYFGKPCGLMDQVACSLGGTLKIDFRTPANPSIHRLTFDPRTYGYELVVVNTGGGHQDLTPEYAAIPDEMGSVARFLGVSSCRDIRMKTFQDRMSEIRKACGDRAVLRCMHYFAENERVDREFDALRRRKFDEFLGLVRQSGNSSMKYLQNIFSASDPHRQNVSIALAATERFLLKQSGGASRVHGGGFAGTIQAYIPVGVSKRYEREMNSLFGEGSVQPIALRPTGAVVRG